jgi:hypothetical protein
LAPIVAAADAWTAVGLIVPVRLSTSPGPARFVANVGSVAAGPPAPVGAALAIPFPVAALSTTTATPITADAARCRAAHPPVLRTAPPHCPDHGQDGSSNRARGSGSTRVSGNVA